MYFCNMLKKGRVEVFGSIWENIILASQFTNQLVKKFLFENVYFQNNSPNTFTLSRNMLQLHDNSSLC